MRKKYVAALLIIILCLSIVLSACTTAHGSKTNNKTEDTEAVETERIEQETPLLTEKEDKQKEDLAEDKRTAGEVAEETTAEKSSIDTEGQGTNEITDQTEQQSPAQQNATRQTTIQQNTAQQNTVQKSSNTNTTAVTNTGNKAANIESMRAKMLELVNAERKKAGISPLNLDAKLTEVATLKAEDMVKNNYFAHISPTYGDPFTMMEQFGLKYMTAGENLAGASTVESAHRGLMNSPGHRANILNPNFIRIGIGIKESPKYGYVFVQMFGGETEDEYIKKIYSKPSGDTDSTTNSSNNTTRPTVLDNVQPLDPETVKEELLQCINNARTKAGVRALVWNDILVQEARKMLEDRNYSVTSERLNSLGLNCKDVHVFYFDTDAFITPDTNSIFNCFLNSNEDIFSSNYWYIGIATKSLPNKSLGVAIVCTDSFTVSEEIRIRGDLEQEVFKQINRIREAAGANPLKWNEAAAQKARDSMKKQAEGIYDNQVTTYSRFYSLKDLPAEVEYAMKSYTEISFASDNPSEKFNYPYISDNSYTQVGVGVCQKVKIETKNGKSEITESEYFIGYIFLKN